MPCIAKQQKKALLASLFCLCLSFNSHAYEYYNSYYGEDETILIEGSTNSELSHNLSHNNAAVKSACKQALQAFIGSLFNKSKNYSQSVMRNFNELSERTNYRLDLKEERIELKLSINL